MDRQGSYDITIIIVNYFSCGFLQRLFHCLEEQPPEKNCECIVVDNSSPPESIRQPEGVFSRFSLFQPGDNTGYAPAVEAARTRAMGRNLFFVNPDTLVTGSCVDSICDFLDNRPEAGAVSPHVRLFTEESPFFVSCLHLPGALRMIIDNSALSRLTLLRNTFRKEWQTDFKLWACDGQAVHVPGVIGALMGIRAEVLEAVGGFDVSFFLSHEDSDLCFRLNKAGYKNYIMKQVEAVHFHAQSRKKAVEQGKGDIISSCERKLPARFLEKHYGRCSRYLFSSILAGERWIKRVRSLGMRRKQEAPAGSSERTDPLVLEMPEQRLWLIEVSHSRAFLHKMAAVIEAERFVAPESVRAMMWKRKTWFRVLRFPCETDSPEPVLEGSFMP